MDKKMLAAALPAVVLAAALPAARAEDCGGYECGLPPVQMAIAQPQVREMLGGAFDLLDLNDDRYVSENEYKHFVDGVDADGMLTPEQKAEKKKRVAAMFDQFDVNGDKRLDKEEFQALISKEAEYGVAERRAQMEAFAKDPELAMKKMNEALGKMEELSKKLDSMSTEEMADNFLANISSGIADENWFQMDANKDGCVTKDEYVAYMSKPQPAGADPLTQLTAAEAAAGYDGERKAKPNCLTKEEYLRNYNELVSADIDDLLAEEAKDDAAGEGG